MARRWRRSKTGMMWIRTFESANTVTGGVLQNVALLAEDDVVGDTGQAKHICTLHRIRGVITVFPVASLKGTFACAIWRVQSGINPPTPLSEANLNDEDLLWIEGAQYGAGFAAGGSRGLHWNVDVAVKRKIGVDDTIFFTYATANADRTYDINAWFSVLVDNAN